MAQAGPLDPSRTILSQPGLQAFRLKRKIPQFKSTQDLWTWRDNPPMPSTQMQLRDEVFDTIVQRLDDENVPTDSLNHLVLAWSLPMTGANPIHWRALLQNPMLVSDAMLGTLIQLQEADQQVKELDEGVKEIYIRSYTLTATQLGRISDIFISQGELVPEAKQWKEVVRSVPGNTPCFVRYCGTTSSVTPWQRQQTDVTQKVTPAARFPQVMRVYYPAVVTNLTIFVLPRARVTFAIQNAHVDVREQALVALMGKSTLLNRQKGGRYPDIRPTMEDAESFGRFGPKILSLMHDTDPCSNTTKKALHAYADATQQYANQRSSTTGTSSYSFTNDYKRVMLNQALPATIKNTSYSPMVLLGHDVLVGSFREATPFFETEIFSSHLMNNIVNWLATLEWNKSKLTDGFAKKLHARGMLPFVNLYQWFKKSREDLPQAINLLRQYLQATKPLVAMTWGEQTTSTAIANFQHDRGIREGDLGFSVGRPVICHYSTDPLNVHDDDWVVIVPSYHPSAGAYGNAEHLLVDIFMQTMMIVWTSASIGMELPISASKLERCQAIIERGEEFMGPNTSFDRAFQTNKQDFMRRQSRSQRSVRPITVLRDVVINHKHVEREYDDLEDSNLDDELDLDSERWKVSKDQLSMVVFCGQPTTHPYTLLRRKEGLRVFNKRYAALQTSKTGGSLKSFILWSEGVRGEDLFYFAATSMADRKRDISELLSIFLPESVQNPNDLMWLDDADILRPASIALEQWVQDRVFPHGTDPEHAIERAMTAWQIHMKTRNPRLYQHLKVGFDVQWNGARRPPRYDNPDQKIHGREVSVLPTGASGTRPALVFEWSETNGGLQKLTASGDESQILLLPEVAMPLFEDEFRSIYFLREGIDIRDSNGMSLRSTGDSITVPLRSIFGGLENPMQAQLLGLWSRETGLGVEDVVFAENTGASDLTEDAFSYPASAFAGDRPGELLRTFGLMSALSSAPTGGSASRFKVSEREMVKRMKMYLPVQAGDALWLFHRFLEEAYPNGGTVDAGEPRLHPFADTVFKKLVHFCKQQKYRKHPQLVGLLLFAETACNPSITPGCVNVIRAILTILRTPVEETKSMIWNRLLKAQKPKFTFKIGTDVPNGNVTPGILPLEDEKDEILEQNTRTLNPDTLMGINDQIDMDEDDGDSADSRSFPSRPVVKKTSHRRKNRETTSRSVNIAESDTDEVDHYEEFDEISTTVAAFPTERTPLHGTKAMKSSAANRRAVVDDVDDMGECEDEEDMPTFPARAKVTKSGRGIRYLRAKADAQQAPGAGVSTPNSNKGYSHGGRSKLADGVSFPSGHHRLHEDDEYSENATESQILQPSTWAATILPSAKSTSSKRKRPFRDDDGDDGEDGDEQNRSLATATADQSWIAPKSRPRPRQRLTRDDNDVGSVASVNVDDDGRYQPEVGIIPPLAGKPRRCEGCRAERKGCQTTPGSTVCDRCTRLNIQCSFASVGLNDGEAQRAGVACQSCRASKVKCDEGQPKCGTCIARGKECSYVKVTPGEAEEARKKRRLK
jgi:hypothetical protein